MPQPIAGLRFSGDGTRLITAGADGKAKLWSLDEGRCLVSVGRPNDRVLAFAVAPNSPTWAVALATGGIELWDGVSPQWRIPLKVAEAPVRQLAFSADGQQLAWATPYEQGIFMENRTLYPEAWTSDWISDRTGILYFTTLGSLTVLFLIALLMA